MADRRSQPVLILKGLLSPPLPSRELEMGDEKV